MESGARQECAIEGQPLRLEYSLGGSGGGGGASGAGTGPDWLCQRCNSVNFARFAGALLAARLRLRLVLMAPAGCGRLVLPPPG
mmetsp:Transcript_26177/g.67307  ORF Transcript_26177/g.67307 Transcript_26177/m.67307 type:complete len:84 (+) Transcript_26177:651-902(+)